MTLFEKLTEWREHERFRHELPDNNTVDEINRLSNYEFLQELSSALEELMKEE